jgi:hypothetical protein
MGINEEAAELRRKQSSDDAQRLAARLAREAAARTEQEKLALLARQFASWAHSNGLPFDRRTGWRRRGWAVLDDSVTAESGKSPVQRLFVIASDGSIDVANVSLEVARAAVVTCVANTGSPWPYPD